ncbi:MAG: cytochrome c oxidase subunit III, partial [Bacteroidota bacterium]
MDEKTSLREQYQQPGDEYGSFAFHPYNVLLILLIISLSVLFLSLSISFVYTRFQNASPPIKLPWIFLFNTVILLASSATMIYAK